MQLKSLVMSDDGEEDGRRRKTRQRVNSTPDLQYKCQLPASRLDALLLIEARQARMRCSRSIVKVALGCTIVKSYRIQTSGSRPRTTKSGGSAFTVTVG